MIKNALTYMFKDNMFLKKAGLYFVLLLVAQICFNVVPIKSFNFSLFPSLLICAVGAIISLVLSGYFFSVMKSIMCKEEDIVLPFMNFKKNLVTGLKWIVALLLFAIGIIVLSALLVFCIVQIYKSGFAVTGALLSVPLYLVIGVGLVLMLPALLAIFANTNEITSLFNINQGFNIICENAKKYFIGYLGYAIVVCITYLFYGVFFDLFVGPRNPIILDPIVFAIVFSLINTLISTYLVFVFAYLFAKMTCDKITEEA